MTSHFSDMPSLLDNILITLDKHKAEQITRIDLKGKSSLAETLVIASGTSSRHIQALAQHLYMHLKQHDFPILGQDGGAGCDWIILDCGDVIVHLFTPEARELYKLEDFWDTDVVKLIKSSSSKA